MVKPYTNMVRMVNSLRNGPKGGEPTMARNPASQRTPVTGNSRQAYEIAAADFTGEQGHIATASNVPLEELQARLSELKAFKTRPVRLVCRTDRRSTQAARLLSEAGFEDARVIEGGMTAWRTKGWPVIESKNHAKFAGADGRGQEKLAG